MSATSLPNPNKACCTIPPVTTHNYQTKGSYETFEDMQVYAVGDTTHKAIICIYDIFGYFPQVLQGADLLSALGFRVLIPDFFRGKPYPSDKFPPYESPLKHFPSTEEDIASFQAFFADAGRMDLRLPELLRLSAWAKEAGAPTVGVYGLCWGGKVAIMAGAHDEAFAAVAQVHPARLAVEDFEALKVPVASFLSQDEDRETGEKGMAVANAKPFGAKNTFKVYDNMHHGFAGSRGNLADPEHLASFTDFYQRLANFFKKAL